MEFELRLSGERPDPKESRELINLLQRLLAATRSGDHDLLTKELLTALRGADNLEGVVQRAFFFSQILLACVDTTLTAMASGRLDGLSRDELYNDLETTLDNLADDFDPSDTS
jgi:hypothetical protein